MDVSVVIPCHNGQPYLAQTIGSVLAQTRPPAELIVVDDSSTDDSAAVARSFGGRVRVESRRFGNAPRARNYGASLTSGEALMFLDADDVLGPGALEALAAEIQRHPDSVAACPWFRLELREGAWVRQPPSCDPRQGRDPLDAWLRGWYHPPCSVLWARSAFDRAGPWRTELSVDQDGDLMMRALVLGVPLRLTTEGEAFYRRLPQGTASLSDARLSESGLRSRMAVVVGIAEMLEERGRLDDHRTAVSYALSRILWDCQERHPELEQECRGLRRRFGEPAWLRMGRSLVRRTWARATATRNRAERVQGGATAHPAELEEIRFGLEEAP